MQLSQKHLNLLSLMDTELDHFKDKLIKLIGGDPGHDIGDAATGLEILSNIATQGHDDDFLLIANGIIVAANTIEHSTGDILELLDLLQNTSDDEVSDFHKMRYNTPAWGF